MTRTSEVRQIKSKNGITSNIFINLKKWHGRHGDRWRRRWRHRRRIRRRNQWYNSRAEESEDRIYRLPPPGNGVPRQANITEFFHRVDTTTQAIQSRECSEIENTAYSIKILQWNACSLNAEKRIQLELLASAKSFDIICISELGNYRQITGYPNYVKNYTFTQRPCYVDDRSPP